LEPVRRVRFTAVDRMAVQEAAALAVETNPTPFFERFVTLPQALGGRFVSADTFKETFDAYRGNPAHRQRYAAPLHNASVMLADGWLRRVLRQPRTPGRDAVLFITGVPGAGKTASVLAAARASGNEPLLASALGTGLPPGTHAVYEKPLAKPEVAVAKIREVFEAGLRPIIVALHTTPERALDNTLRRFAAIGRGASIHTLARIQGYLPASLTAVQTAFGDAVALRIIDRRDFDAPRLLQGWVQLPLLTSEGNREHIQQRLERHLQTRRDALSVAAWRQACGLPPE
jgi:hypothetical protein